MNLPVWFHRHRFAKNATKLPMLFGLDFHSHILPGIDDGSTSFEEAKRAILLLKTMGYTGAVLTPHIYKDVFNNNSVELRRVFSVFCDNLRAEYIEFPLHLAAEYFSDEHFLELIAQDDLLYTMVGDERWVLLEFSYIQESSFASACLSALVKRGYRPVIAHVERYRFVAQDAAKWLEKFTQSNAILQGDIGSLAGQYGEAVKRFSLALLKARKIDIWGTDLHNPAQFQKYIAPGLAKLGVSYAGAQLNKLLDPIGEVNAA